MRNLACVAVLSALITGTVLRAQAPAVPPELKRLDGFWKPQSVVADGQEQLKSAEAKASITLRIKDGEYALFQIADAKEDKHYRLCTADLRLDPAAKTFELAVKQGFKKGQKMHGVYEHTSNEFKVCYGPAEKPRPTKFEAPKGSDYFCETWVPEKK